jgi:hypothetical protein
MATITVRALDQNWDPICGQGLAAFISDLDAVAQIIATTLKLFQGEWFASTQQGTPYFGAALGRSGSAQQQMVFVTAIKAQILSVPYVTGITSLVTTYYPTSRAFALTCQAVTPFGATTVTYPVGAIY